MSGRGLSRCITPERGGGPIIQSRTQNSHTWRDAQAVLTIGRSQGGAQFPTGGIARERLVVSCETPWVSRSGVTPGPTV
jgi:hypothetical protein